MVEWQRASEEKEAGSGEEGAGKQEGEPGECWSAPIVGGSVLWVGRREDIRDGTHQKPRRGRGQRDDADVGRGAASGWSVFVCRPDCIDDGTELDIEFSSINLPLYGVSEGGLYVRC